MAKLKNITDAEILDFLHTGLLTVDVTTGEVWWGGEPRAVTRAGSHGFRNRVEIRYEGHKRTIYLNKLVYMAATRKPIPVGYQIHHIDEDNTNDVWSNLICVSIQDHLKLHSKETEEVPF